MASEFVRKVKGIRNIDILSPNITTENDLISTIDGEVYVATNKGYRKITNIEVQDFENLKNEVSKINNQSDTNTINIRDLTDDVETNTSEIEKLKTNTDTNTSDIGTLQSDVSTNTSEIETLKTNTDNNTSEIDTLKTKINNDKVLLFDGSAGDTEDLITLNQSYKDFTELKIKISRTGGNENFNFDTENEGTIPINHTNLFNSGSGYSLHEMLLRKNSSTELEIFYQGYFDSNGTSTNESNITILKIWGVK